MQKKRKKKRLNFPHFVKAKILPGGSAVLEDDNGEVFMLQMRKREAWPIMSRLVRRFEMNEKHDLYKHQPSPRPTSPPKLKAV